MGTFPFGYKACTAIVILFPSLGVRRALFSFISYRPSSLIADGRVVMRCSKLLSDCEIGTIVDSGCWTSCSAVGWLVSGYSGSVGAGRAVNRGEASISVSLDVSAAGRLAICLVYTIV
jgi:hypothetical protein